MNRFLARKPIIWIAVIIAILTSGLSSTRGLFDIGYGLMGPIRYGYPISYITYNYAFNDWPNELMPKDVTPLVLLRNIDVLKLSKRQIDNHIP